MTSMLPASDQNLQLTAWTDTGELVLNRAIEARTLSLSGRDDADIMVPELGDRSVFVRASIAGGTLYVHAPGAQETKLSLRVGMPVKAGGLTWVVTLAPRPAPGAAALDDHQAEGRYDQLLSELIAWLTRPMTGLRELREGLRGFLSLIVRNTPAANGMLVLADGGGYDLVTAFGLSPEDATKLWEKMPHALAEEVLRTNARILLPEELRRQTNGDSTVFVRGVRSVAGFPALAEGRLVAVFYLGFDNILRSLSAELQTALEAAADILGLVVQRASLREQLAQLTLAGAAAADRALPPGRLMVGASAPLIEVYAMIARLAPVDVATLITGETGTGKELAAKELHRLSPRAQRPFVVVNAAALPASLIESELFGHKKGAFTGALTDRVGLVEQAQGGTLFIDEIGELSPAMQAKLLRVLQEYAVTRVGEATTRPVDFRLVTATHRNLEEMVAVGDFREDLFYRIAGAKLRMPALRERPGDVHALASFFRQQFAERHGLADKEWSQDALLTLEAAPWPGNVRELENVVARAFVMAEGTVIRRQDLGLPGDDAAAIAGHGDLSAESDVETLMAARDQWMRGFLTRALRRHNGRRADTAKALGIGERTLFRCIEQLDIRDG
jgi:transcriptional regulator with GAF, ATPase, and Fis domain